MVNLIFLKLGGSLITDKTTPRRPRHEVIVRLVDELKEWRIANDTWRMVLGHGSGSFGHNPAKRYGTRQGVTTPEEWQGFAEVWHEAQALNHIVMDALQAVGLPGIAFPVSGGATAQDGLVKTWGTTPLCAALENNLLPVVFGDVVFDTLRGGTILSTEDIFTHLGGELQPQRILLAGIDEGVWADFPDCTQLIPEITPANIEAVIPNLGGSAATDVTGGMGSKVRQMLALTEKIPGVEIVIFNGNQPGNLMQVLRRESLGTRIVSK